MKFNGVLAIIVASGLVFGASGADAQVSLVMTSEFSPRTTLSVGDRYFADRVSEISGGSLEIDLHLGGELGYRSADNLEAVSNGLVDIASTLSGALGQEDPVFLVSLLPFVVDGAEEAGLLYEIALPFYQEFFANNEQILLYASPWPASGLWSNRPIETADDLANLRLRTYDPLGTQAFAEAGAEPVQISWSDVRPRLEAGEIDGVITAATGGFNGGFNEYLSYFSAINYASTLQFIHMSLEAFESLSDEHQAIILQAAEETIAYNRQYTAEQLSEIYETMANSGVNVVPVVSDELRWHLVSSAGPVLANWMVEAGERGQSILSSFSVSTGQ